MKAKIRKTGEIVEIISYTGSPNRNEVLDSVSYIDSKGNEHPREKLNFYWDFELIQGATAKSTEDWQQVTNQAAIGAMQVILASLQYPHMEDVNKHEIIVSEAILYARMLVEKLKNIV